MTRINVVPPSELTDQHLMAEYRELPRIFTETRKRIAKGLAPGDIDAPDAYRLGAGHCKFFMLRCGWLRKRYTDLCAELLRRGYNLNAAMFYAIRTAADALPPEWCGDYVPTAEAISINRERIALRRQGK